MIDLAEVIERLVPQASYDTARATDIDISDYAALVRTWHDTRPVPTLAMVDATRDQMIQEQITKQQNRSERLQEFFDATNALGTLPTNAEINAIANLNDAKAMLIRFRQELRAIRALVRLLRNRQDVPTEGG